MRVTILFCDLLGLDQAVQAHPTSANQIPTSFFDQKINDLNGNLTDVRKQIATATEDHRVQGGPHLHKGRFSLSRIGVDKT